jgi:LAO/AO transport system kinase
MTNNLAKRILSGDVRTLASLMSLIEDGDPKAKAILKAVYPHTGGAHVIGVTGAAGAGKSSLIERMVAHFRREKKTVGILAVDPTSRFSTGALLGDRIRMRDHFADPGVFIRSFATRGAGGGVSASVRKAIHLLDAAGKDVIFIETIGVGQDQLEIAALAHTVVVVLTPQMGDDVQIKKAGLAEIADILVLNKADLSGAEEAVRQLRAFFGEEDFPIVSISATQSEGIPLLMALIEKHRKESLDNGKYQNKRTHFCRQELLSLLREKVFARLAKKIVDSSFETEVKRIAEGQTDPYSAADRLARRIDV